MPVIETPTDEQIAIINFAKAGKGNLVVDALAGSGKTTALRMMLEVLPQRSALVCAFNKRIADEFAGSLPPMPPTHAVHVKTFHAQGLAMLKAYYPRLTISGDSTEELINRTAGASIGFQMRRSAVRLLRTLKETTCTPRAPSAAIVLALGHEHDLFGKLTDSAIDLTVEVVRDAYLVSLDFDNRESIDFCDMVWAPLALNLAPKTRYQAIFVDELQDISEPQLAMVRKLMVPAGRFFGVGDLHQCHPPGTLIRTPSGLIPIEKLDETADRIVPWIRKSQVSSGQRAFKVAWRAFSGELLKIHAGSGFVEMTPNHKLLCRWTDKTKMCVYLMYRADRGFRIGWCQMHAKGGGLHLSQRARLERAEAIWVLAVFDRRVDASVYESIVAARYGLATATFEPHGRDPLYNQDAVERIFAGLDPHTQRDRATNCLKDHGREFDLPAWPYPARQHKLLKDRPTYFLCYAANIIPGMMAIPHDAGVNHWETITRVERRQYTGPVYSLDVDTDHLYSTGGGLVVHNSIYGWRGANAVRAFGIARDELKAKFLPLTTTWRCAKSIVEVARAIVPKLRARPDAPAGNVQECTWASLPGAIETHTIAREQSGPGIHTFVLSRNNAHILDCALFLWRERVNFQLNAGAELLDPLNALLDKLDTSGAAKFKSSLAEWRATELARAEKLNAAAWADRVEEQAAMLTVALNYAAPNQLKSLLHSIIQPNKSGVLLSTVHKVKGLEAERVFLLKQTFQRHDDRACFTCGGDGRSPARGFGSPEHCMSCGGSGKFIGDIDPAELNVEYVAITRAKSRLIWVDIRHRSDADRRKSTPRDSLGIVSERDQLINAATKFENGGMPRAMAEGLADPPQGEHARDMMTTNVEPDEDPTNAQLGDYGDPPSEAYGQDEDR